MFVFKRIKSSYEHVPIIIHVCNFVSIWLKTSDMDQTEHWVQVYSSSHSKTAYWCYYNLIPTLTTILVCTINTWITCRCPWHMYIVLHVQQLGVVCMLTWYLFVLEWCLRARTEMGLQNYWGVCWENWGPEVSFLPIINVWQFLLLMKWFISMQYVTNERECEERRYRCQVQVCSPLSEWLSKRLWWHLWCAQRKAG